MNKITYIHEEIVRHMHPAWDSRGKDDKLYAINNENWKHDMSNFNSRRRKGFPI